MPDQPGSLAQALADLQTQLPHVTKDGTNPHFGSRYATLEDISAALLPLMGKLGLSWSCKPTRSGDGVSLEYVLRHAPSGEHDSGEYPLPASGNPQQMGSAITYARRYALCAVTGLTADLDDDGNAATNPAGNSPETRKTPPPRPRASRATPAQQRASGAPSGTPTQQRDERRRRIDEERAVAAAKQPGRPADRSNDPADAAPWESDPEDRPGTISTGQLRAMSALLSKAGCQDKEDRHALIVAALNIDAVPADPASGAPSAKGLSLNQAADVIRYLSQVTGDPKAGPPDHAQRAANDDLWEGMETQ